MQICIFLFQLKFMYFILFLVSCFFDFLIFYGTWLWITFIGIMKNAIIIKAWTPHKWSEATYTGINTCGKPRGTFQKNVSHVLVFSDDLQSLCEPSFQHLTNHCCPRRPLPFSNSHPQLSLSESMRSLSAFLSCITLKLNSFILISISKYGLMTIAVGYWHSSFISSLIPS